MKKIYPKFSLFIHYRDTDLCVKEIFESKRLALDWFESFKQVNKRPVTVTFYFDITPYWVYRFEKA